MDHCPECGGRIHYRNQYVAPDSMCTCGLPDISDVVAVAHLVRSFVELAERLGVRKRVLRKLIKASLGLSREEFAREFMVGRCAAGGWEWKCKLGRSERRDRERILHSQEHRCGICGDVLDLTSSKAPAIDHDHSTGVMRGVLCQRCNLGVGMYESWYLEYKDRVEAYLRNGAYNVAEAVGAEQPVLKLRKR